MTDSDKVRTRITCLEFADKCSWGPKALISAAKEIEDYLFSSPGNSGTKDIPTTSADLKN